MANSGTTTIGRGVDAPEGSVWEGLRSLGVTVGFGIGVGKICQHFKGVVSSCKGGMVTLLPLEVAIVLDVTGALVTPTIRIVGGRGKMEVLVNECGGCTTCGCGIGAVDIRSAERISIRRATGDPNNATSSCWRASAWSNLARLWM